MPDAAPDILRLVLFGSPGAGKSSLLGASPRPPRSSRTCSTAASPTPRRTSPSCAVRSTARGRRPPKRNPSPIPFV